MKALQVPNDDWFYILVPLTINRLDRTTRRDWEDHTGGTTDPAKYNDLIEFLEKRLRTLEAMNTGELSQQKKSGLNTPQGRKLINSENSSLKVSKSNVKSSKWSACSNSHYISACEVFKGKPVKERLDLMKSSRLWILTCSSGNLPTISSKTCQVVTSSDEPDLVTLLQQFWEFEAVPPPSPMAMMSANDAACERHFAETFSRKSNGKFSVRLTFKASKHQFTNSFNIAKRKFLSFKYSVLIKYSVFMSEYLS